MQEKISHGFTQINTDKTCFMPDFQPTEKVEIKNESKPFHPCKSVFIRGSIAFLG